MSLLAPRAPRWWILDDVNGCTEFVLHVLEDPTETWVSLAVSRNKCNSQLIFLSMLITKLGIPASETSLPLGV